MKKEYMLKQRCSDMRMTLWKKKILKQYARNQGISFGVLVEKAVDEIYKEVLYVSEIQQRRDKKNKEHD